MNLVDVVILVTALAAGMHGLLLGAAVQVFSFGGLTLGLALGAALAPTAASFGNDPPTKAFLALLSLFGLAAVVGTLGRVLGIRVWRRLRRFHLARVDSILGFVLATGSALVSAWLIGSMLATAPARPIAMEVQHSAILRHLDQVLPRAPSVFARLQRLIDAGGLPQVFADLEPTPSARLPLPADPIVRAAVLHAGASTVKIVGAACGLIQEGSGFVAAPNLVVTNAHVVAGVHSPSVLDSKGSHSAITVLFDPDLDIAVLRVAVNDPVLHLTAANAPRGTSGAVLGYPGGGPFDAEPAVVLDRRQAVGRNIYGDGLVTRAIYELRSLVRPGNSGGPLVEPDGTVAGVVFARSSLANDIGYALTGDEVQPKLVAAESRTTAVSTGTCTAG